MYFSSNNAFFLAKYKTFNTLVRVHLLRIPKATTPIHFVGHGIFLTHAGFLKTLVSNQGNVVARRHLDMATVFLVVIIWGSECPLLNNARYVVIDSTVARAYTSQLLPAPRAKSSEIQ